LPSAEIRSLLHWAWLRVLKLFLMKIIIIAEFITFKLCPMRPPQSGAHAVAACPDPARLIFPTAGRTGILSAPFIAP
jgi:hypothetical protein